MDYISSIEKICFSSFIYTSMKGFYYLFTISNGKNFLSLSKELSENLLPISVLILYIVFEVFCVI